jgi:hypothetical protein
MLTPRRPNISIVRIRGAILDHAQNRDAGDQQKLNDEKRSCQGSAAPDERSKVLSRSPQRGLGIDR